MTSPARKTTRRKAEPPNESSVYDGSELLGTITPRAASRGERVPQPKILEHSQT